MICNVLGEKSLLTRLWGGWLTQFFSPYHILIWELAEKTAPNDVYCCMCCFLKSLEHREYEK